MAKQTSRKRTAQPQLVVRISSELDRNLRKAADGLELDLSGLVRMILTEHLAGYIERGLSAKRRLKAAHERLSAEPPIPGQQGESHRNLEI